MSDQTGPGVSDELTVSDEIEIQMPSYASMRDRLLADPVFLNAVGITARQASRSVFADGLRRLRNLGGPKVVPAQPPQTKPSR